MQAFSQISASGAKANDRHPPPVLCHCVKVISLQLNVNTSVGNLN